MARNDVAKNDLLEKLTAKGVVIKDLSMYETNLPNGYQEDKEAMDPDTANLLVNWLLSEGAIKINEEKMTMESVN